LDNGDPRAARDAYLDTLPLEEQARVLRQAEKMGPLPSDSDWLVAYAAGRAAARVETAVASFESRVDVAMKKGAKETGRAIARDRSTSRELFAFALSLAAFAGVAWFVDSSAARVQTIVLYATAIALGVAAAALYVWISKHFSRAH